MLRWAMGVALMMEAVSTSKMVSFYKIALRPSSQKTIIFILTAVRT
jgi:hypothetical protein